MPGRSLLAGYQPGYDGLRAGGRELPFLKDKFLNLDLEFRDVVMGKTQVAIRIGIDFRERISSCF